MPERENDAFKNIEYENIWTVRIGGIPVTFGRTTPEDPDDPRVTYSVWLKRVDGNPLGRIRSDRTRKNGTEFMLLEAAYAISHGSFRLIKEPAERNSYREGWNQLRTWALREKELNESSAVPNQAQLQTLNALLHRMDRYQHGDPDAFRTI